MATAPIFLKVNSNSLKGEPDGLMLRPCCENVSFYHLCILSPPPNLFQIHRTKYPLFFFTVCWWFAYWTMVVCIAVMLSCQCLLYQVLIVKRCEKVSSPALRPDWWIGQRVNQHISYNTFHWNISIQWEMEGTVERYWYPLFPTRCCSHGATIRVFQPHERDIIA